MITRRELERRCDVITDTLAGLAMEVSRLRKDLDETKKEMEEARKTDGGETREELMEKKFQQGLDEILSYTGRPVKEGADGK